MNNKRILSDISTLVTETSENATEMLEIVRKLMGHLVTWPSISSQAKNMFNEYLAKIDSIELSQIISNGEVSLLKDYLLLILLDITIYDIHLINLLCEHNISIEKIIVALLINNISDLNDFCAVSGLIGVSNKIVTLKSLSGYEKLVNRF